MKHFNLVIRFQVMIVFTLIMIGIAFAQDAYGQPTNLLEENIDVT